MRDFSNHAKKSHIVDRDKWDWSLSNCDLGRLHGMSPQAVRKTRIKLGKDAYVTPKRDRPPSKPCKCKGLGVYDLRDGPKAQTPMLDRFWSKVRLARPDLCWGWTGIRNNWGYGQLPVGQQGENRRTHAAHRVSYAIHFGGIPAGMLVRHKCDNPNCVNPNHLELGLPVDNVRDACERGQMNYGEKNGQSKYTAQQVREVRRRFDSGERHFQIAIAMDLPVSVVWGMATRHTWRHVL